MRLVVQHPLLAFTFILASVRLMWNLWEKHFSSEGRLLDVIQAFYQLRSLILYTTFGRSSTFKYYCHVGMSSFMCIMVLGTKTVVSTVQPSRDRLSVGQTPRKANWEAKFALCLVFSQVTVRIKGVFIAVYDMNKLWTALEFLSLLSVSLLNWCSLYSNICLR